ncbi:MAG TPA: flagellar hook-basal body complex protein FliE [Jatrophihabitans sp.]|nr:flagellar hook-basal body complex protein FliE [Jatrophihabitans sp.]
MTVPAIGAIGAGLPVTGTTGAAATGLSAGAATGSTGSDFAAMLEKGLNAVQSAQDTADSLAVQAATGDLTDIHQYTIAATQASLLTELATTLRTKGIDAFNQIMGMQA